MGGNKLKHKQIEVPKQLQSIPDPPKQLFAIGDTLEQLLDQPRVAVVGARKMTSYGKAVTEKLSSELSKHGVVVVSGLAYGVDSCAHKSASDAGGKCIAVLACGLDQMYPTANQRLADKIIENRGVIISEYPDKTEPMRHRFLERNRLISGLSNVILITEAAQRSGSLNTAAHALNQGKTVLAVPGNIYSPLSQGTNNLIKQGAIPVTDIQDILSVLGINKSAQTAMPLASNQEEYVVLKLLHSGTTDGVELLNQSELDAVLFNQTMTMLELSGSIKPLGNNHWTIS